LIVTLKLQSKVLSQCFTMLYVMVCNDYFQKFKWKLAGVKTSNFKSLALKTAQVCNGRPARNCNVWMYAPFTIGYNPFLYE